jgi:hypothetical protein
MPPQVAELLVMVVTALVDILGGCAQRLKVVAAKIKIEDKILRK